MRPTAALSAILAIASLLHAPVQAQTTPVCDADNAGLQLPPGFCGSIFARGLIRPRHMAVAPNGDVFVISNRGRAADTSTAGPRPGVYRLRDADGDGRAERSERVGDGIGTGLAIAHGALYAEAGAATIVRYPFRSGSWELTGAVDTIVTDMPVPGSHFQRNFVIRGDELFVNVGSPGNACTPPGRASEPGPDPCPELDTRAGIWRFSATQKNQRFSPQQRFATGFRNAVALTADPQGGIWAAQHGRDQLGPIMNRSAEYNAENPGEELHVLVQGADYGWPYCYYSHEEGRKVLAPEYGGDGRSVGRCANVVPPVYAFPGHWAPNAAFFYTGAQFPAEYRAGIFIAFHGSWNRAPLPQAGFNVTFLPLRDGRPAGPHRVFADGFNERRTPDAPADARGHRPTGLAQLPDGSLLVSDDAGGTIFRISYRGR